MKTCDNINCYEEGNICIPTTNMPRLVIIGGGFAGLKLIRSLKNKNIQVVLFDKNNFHQFIPLLYQVATSAIEPDSIVFPYRKMFRKYKKLVYRMAEVNNVFPDKNKISTSIGDISYDFLVIASGSTTNYFGNDDIEKYGIGLKSITNALDIRSLLLQNLEEAVLRCIGRDKIALGSVVIVGGGPAGVEMAGALAEFNRYILPKDYPELKKIPVKIVLCEGTDRLLQSMPEKLSKKTYSYLKKLGVDIKLNTLVKKYNNQQVEFANGETMNVSALLWTAGVKGELIHGINKESISQQQRIFVDEFNKVNGLDNVFALGDIAIMKTVLYPNGHPMVAQVAIQQGGNLANNLLSTYNKSLWRKFNYKDKGSMATIGKKKAVAYINHISVWGFTAWFLWSFIHLMSIIGVRNKVLVGLNWLWSYFSYDKGDRVIIRKYFNQRKYN
jgi:NADH dehydrogenase